MSLQTVNISLNSNDGVLNNVILGKIFIDTDKASIDYFDVDGKPQHIILFENALDTNLFMLKSQYDANNDGVVDNTLLFDNHPSSYYAKASDLALKGDMFKVDYDSNNDGVVNNSDRLGGQLPAYYAAKSYVDVLFEKAEADIYEAPDEATQLSLSTNKGDFVKRTDNNVVYINNGGTAGDMTDWTEIATGSGELEKITENGNTGWRLKGRDPNNYGDIGNGAVDFSYSNTSSTTYGATGDYSFADGYGATASGNYSHAEGKQTTANNHSSHAEGYKTTSSGIATHTEGRGTVASGHFSHAEGWYASASGTQSHAEGMKTIAQNNSSHAEGKYNVGTSPDTIHETGIGTADYNRKNAFEIYTDGTLTAPECTNTLIDARGNKALVTKEYLLANSSPADNVVQMTGQTDYTLSINSSNYFEITLTSDSTIDIDTNEIYGLGKVGTIVVIQGNNSVYDITSWGNDFVFPNGNPLLNQNLSSYNIFKYTVIKEPSGSGVSRTKGIIFVEFVGEYFLPRN